MGVTLSELKNKWEFTGIDVEKMVKEISSLLTEYGHRNSEYGIIQLLAVFIKNKKELIELMMKHQNYNNNLQIVMEEEFDRDIDTKGIQNFMGLFLSNVKAKEKILKTENEKGETYFSLRENLFKPERKGVLNVDELEEFSQKSNEILGEFNHEGITVSSADYYRAIENCLYYFKYYQSGTIDETFIKKIQELIPGVKLGSGMKTSRAFNKFCTYIGVAGTPEYNAEFPKYADMINALKRNLNYVISLNPIDYLTMSFGNTWASCHTIDRENLRDRGDHYHGQYCAGTISYMLDSTSFINYVVPITTEEKPETLDKIYRNMFHFDNGILVQGRVYPQAKDGATDLYLKMRSIMQKALKVMLDTEENWVKKNIELWEGYDGDSCIESYGSHYRDYDNYEDCNVSALKSKMEDLNYLIDYEKTIMSVGHPTVCVYCGEQHFSYSEMLSLSDCEYTD